MFDLSGKPPRCDTPSADPESSGAPTRLGPLGTHHAGLRVSACVCGEHGLLCVVHVCVLPCGVVCLTPFSIVSRSLCVVANGIISFFLRLRDIPLYKCTAFSLSVHLSRDGQVVSMSCLCEQCCCEQTGVCILLDGSFVQVFLNFFGCMARVLQDLSSPTRV